ncbi:MAG TPA: DUF1259 domain-containing protein [Terriglobales bacterium]|nr:DUF1259 domain-containing protein [Terriglobales bacterium]
MRILATLALTCALTALAQQPSSQWAPVDKAMGRAGKAQPGDVYKYAMPRGDMQVSVAGTPIKAGLALGSWAAFKKMGNAAVVMGDLVLADDEVEPVMLKLEQGGIEITALHNHLLHETPRVLYMHIHGRGDAVKLATAIHDALALTKTPAAAPAPAASQSAPTIDTAKVEAALGRKGTDANGILQFSIPRAETITDSGIAVPPSMGVATGINFQPTGGGKAAITGDFVLLAKEVNPVIRALRENGIEVEALHSHMLTEQPRLFFMHFWANDDAVKLAKGLRAALDQTKSAPAK